MFATKYSVKGASQKEGHLSDWKKSKIAPPVNKSRSAAMVHCDYLKKAVEEVFIPEHWHLSEIGS